MELYFKSEKEFEAAASDLHAQLGATTEMQAREGLNIGGGEYFLYKIDESEIILCRNEDLMEVVEMPGHPYFLYVYRGPDEELRHFEAAIARLNLEFEYGDYRLG